MSHTNLLTIEEVASRLRASTKTIRNWVYSGKLPYLKVNGLLRFDKEEIDNFIEDCRRE